MGVYSILNNKWVKVPQKLNLDLDKDAIQRKYTETVLKIKKAIKSSEMSELKKVMKSLYDMREVGLSTEGEFSTENIVFKLIRSKNYIDQLKTAISNVYDLQRSLKES